MITTTLGALAEAEPALQRVCALPLRAKDQPEGLTPKVKYHLAKLARLVKVETRHLAAEQVVLAERQNLFGGQPIKDIDPRVWADYQKEARELGEVEVSIEWDPVSSADVPLALASDLADLGPLCELVEPVA